MAEPARRLDEVGAAASLRRSRTAARRDAASPRKRGQVLEFPGGRELGSGIAANRITPAETGRIREAEIYNFPTSPEERSAREAQNRERWMEERVQARASHLSFIQAPPAYRELSQEMRREPEVQAAYRDFRAEAATIVTQDRLTSAEFRNRLQVIRRLNEANRRLSEQVAKFRAAIDKVKKGKDFLWTTYEVTSLAETEGALAETWNVSGIFISLYRGIKTILMPHAQTSTDPDAGQFFKGMLSFAEPTAFRVKDVTAWLGGFHALYGYFGLFLLLATFLGIFVIIAFLFLSFGSILDAMGVLLGAGSGATGGGLTGP